MKRHLWHNDYHHIKWIQILDEAICATLGTNVFGEYMNPSPISTNYGQIAQTELFSLSKETSLAV